MECVDSPVSITELKLKNMISQTRRIEKLWEVQNYGLETEKGSLVFRRKIMKKIIIFGCQQIAVDFIEYVLNQNEVEISLVVTYELILDKTYGYESVIENFAQTNIEVEYPPRIAKSLIDKIRDINLIIFFQYITGKYFLNHFCH